MNKIYLITLYLLLQINTCHITYIEENDDYIETYGMSNEKLIFYLLVPPLLLMGWLCIMVFIVYYLIVSILAMIGIYIIKHGMQDYIIQ